MFCGIMFICYMMEGRIAKQLANVYTLKTWNGLS